MYYRQIVIFFPLIAVLCKGYGQSADHGILDPARLPFYDLKLEAQRIAPGVLQLPFESVRVIDSRFDTTKFGFITPRVIFLVSRKSTFRQLRFNGGVGVPLQQYYNDYYSNAFTKNGFELLIVMKRFWVSGIRNQNGQEMDRLDRDLGDLNMHIKWEYYLGRSGRYLPAKRLDTIVHFRELPGGDVDEGFRESKLGDLKFLLKGLVEIYDFNAAVVAFDSNPVKTMQQIDAYNSSRFNIRVLQDSSIKKGVYLSYEEFRNNKPSITEYKEKKMRYNSFTRAGLYLEDMQGNAINTYWGYGNGTSFRFSRYGNKRMFRTGNTFEFFMESMILTRDQYNRNSSAEVWVPYQLDMETGLIY